MKLNNNLLLIIAIVAIGMFVLPTTLSMFTGQHSWYDPNDRGIPCAKCHEMELYELSAVTGPHSSGYGPLINSSADYATNDGSVNGSLNFWGDGTAGDRCYGCHQIGNNASGDTTFGNYSDSLHAAIRVECVDCHPWVHTELSNSSEAHRSFYQAVGDDTNGTALLMGANEACIACHTHVGVNITWNRAVYLAFNVSVNTTSDSYEVLWNASEDLGSNITKTSNETTLW